MASRSPVAIRAISVASGMSRRALGSREKRGQAAVPSTVAVSLRYMSISPHVDHRDHLPFSEKPRAKSPRVFGDDRHRSAERCSASVAWHKHRWIGAARSIAPRFCGIRSWLATLSEGLEPRGSIARLGAWGLFWCRLKHIGHSAEFGKRTGLHLPHQVGAMHFHRGFGDADIVGNLLVEATCRDLHHDLPLA